MTKLELNRLHFVILSCICVLSYLIFIFYGLLSEINLDDDDDDCRSSNSLRRQAVRQGSSTNQTQTTSSSASTSAALDMQVFRRVNRGTKARFPLPELTARVDGPVSITCQLPC